MKRESRVDRKTSETRIRVAWKIDGTGRYKISTGVPLFDHMLELFARHGFFDLEVGAKGDVAVDSHHTVEDIGIAMGKALKDALPGFEGVNRYGWAAIPMDECLCLCAIDLSGRPSLVMNGKLRGKIGTFDVEVVKEFLKGFVNEARIALHVNVLYGENLHHKVECIFKSFARALSSAVAANERVQGALSTKGVL
jgi:imidazoleglycerol-phosphate dehydratase